MINTVLGKISPDALGQTLIHEHITCADWSMRMNFGKKFLDPEKVVSLAARMLGDAMGCGISTMVDGSAINLGRDVRLIRECAKASGMNIIVSSGFYYQTDPQLAVRDPGYLYDMLLDECVNGIDGTGILPGVMKAGTAAAGLTPYHKKLLSVIARVAADAKLPAFCHHDVSSKCGAEIADLFMSKGVRPESLILGHSGDSADKSYLDTLFATGCYIGFDRMGFCDRPLGKPLEQYVDNIMHYAGKGYTDRILMSHDFAVYMAFREPFEEVLENYESGSAPNFTIVSKKIIPALKSAGMTEDIIHTIMVENPKRFLSSCL